MLLVHCLLSLTCCVGCVFPDLCDSPLRIVSNFAVISLTNVAGCFILIVYLLLLQCSNTSSSWCRGSVCDKCVI